MHTVLLLAAGVGRGAWPYSGLRRKTTLPVAQVPLVRRLALQWKRAGAKDIIVVTDADGGAVRACTADIPGVRFAVQEKPQGCGDAARAGLAVVQVKRAAVCHGDIVTTQTAIKTLLDADREQVDGALVLGVPHRPGIAAWDSLEVDSTDSVCGVWNKGNTGQPRFGGMAVCDVALLKTALEQSPGYVDNVGVGAMPPAENSLAAAINRLCRNGHQVRCVHSDAPFVDVNRPWDLVEANHVANRDLLAEHQGVVLAEDARIDDGADIPDGATILLGKGARIGKGVIVKGDVILGEGAQAIHGAILGANVHIGAHSVVRDYASVLDNTTVGPGNVIGHCAEFSGVSLEHTLLWHYCCMSAVIGARVDIGAATCCGTWRFDDQVREQQVDGHFERPPYHGGMAFIGDRTRTGVNVMINPGVRIGSHCCIGPGVLLYEDVPDGQCVLARQEHSVKPWGANRYAW